MKHRKKTVRKIVHLLLNLIIEFFRNFKHPEKKEAIHFLHEYIKENRGQVGDHLVNLLQLIEIIKASHDGELVPPTSPVTDALFSPNSKPDFHDADLFKHGPVAIPFNRRKYSSQNNNNKKKNIEFAKRH